MSDNAKQILYKMNPIIGFRWPSTEFVFLQEKIDADGWEITLRLYGIVKRMLDELEAALQQRGDAVAEFADVPGG